MSPTPGRDSHLGHLTLLSLSNIDDPFSNTTPAFGGWFFEDERPHPGLIKKRKRYGSHPEDIRRALTIAKVHLTTISVDNVPRSFLDYLLSYSGMKELYLESGGLTTGESSDAMALSFFLSFFERRLDNHSQSLESLRIRVHYEGLWCSNSHRDHLEAYEIKTPWVEYQIIRLGGPLQNTGP